MFAISLCFKIFVSGRFLSLSDRSLCLPECDRSLSLSDRSWCWVRTWSPAVSSMSMTWPSTLSSSVSVSTLCVCVFMCVCLCLCVCVCVYVCKCVCVMGAHGSQNAKIPQNLTANLGKKLLVHLIH